MHIMVLGAHIEDTGTQAPDCYTTLHIYTSKLQPNSSNINPLIKAGVGRLYLLVCECAHNIILNLYFDKFESIHKEIIYGWK